MVRLGGLTPPNTEKVRLDGLAVKTGKIVSVTDTLTDGLKVVGAEIVIAALYVPAVRPLILTEATSVEGAAPLVGLTVSHEASSLAVQFRAPATALLTLGLGRRIPAPCDGCEIQTWRIDIEDGYIQGR
jgi:hypothetical protein